MAKPMQQLERATAQVRNNDLAEAIETLKEILADDAKHEIATGMLASIYFEIGRVEAAIDLYEKLLSYNPDNPLARFQLGLARLNDGQPRQALDVWEPMLEMENDFMAHFHSALAQLELQQPRQALELLLKAREHMPVGHPLYPQLLDLHNKLTGG